MNVWLWLWMCVFRRPSAGWSPLHYSNVRYWLSCCSSMRLTCNGACGRWLRRDSLFAYRFVHLTTAVFCNNDSVPLSTDTNKFTHSHRSKPMRREAEEKTGRIPIFYFLFIRIGSFYGFCFLLSSTSNISRVSRIFGLCFVSKLCTHTHQVVSSGQTLQPTFMHAWLYISFALSFAVGTQNCVYIVQSSKSDRFAKHTINCSNL